MGRRGQGRGPQPPVRDCDHAYGMNHEPEMCWCEHCGQTWKMLVNRETGDYRGWFPLPIREVSYGRRHSYS